MEIKARIGGFVFLTVSCIQSVFIKIIKKSHAIVLHVGTLF